MDIILGLIKTLEKDKFIWIIVDRQTDSDHFIPIGVDYISKYLAKIYIKEILRLYGLPITIIFYRVT